jgi:hypothetical protein
VGQTWLGGRTETTRQRERDGQWAQSSLPEIEAGPQDVDIILAAFSCFIDTDGDACVQESCRDVLKVQLRLRCFRVASRNGGRTAVWGICSEAPVYTRDGLMRDTK